MKRAFLAALVLSSGCINFEKEFEAHGAQLPSRDAGSDAGDVADAGTLDAGTLDAGTLDAGTADAGFCSALGCFSPIYRFTDAWTVAAAVYGRPEGTVFLGTQSGAISWHATVKDDVVTELGRLEIGADEPGSITGVVSAGGGNYLTWGADGIAHVGSPAAEMTTTCGTATTSWRGAGVGPDGVYFLRETDALCLWTADAGFQAASVTAPAGVTRLIGLVTSPDGGRWVLDYDTSQLFDLGSGAPIDPGTGHTFTSVTRVGDEIYAWSSSGGFDSFRPDAGWEAITGEAVDSVWGEPGNIWAMRATQSGPRLRHREDGGWKLYTGAALFPPLPAGNNLYAISGEGSRLMLMGNFGLTTGGLAVEIRR